MEDARQLGSELGFELRLRIEETWQAHRGKVVLAVGVGIVVGSFIGGIAFHAKLTRPKNVIRT